MASFQTKIRAETPRKGENRNYRSVPRNRKFLKNRKKFKKNLKNTIVASFQAKIR